MDTFDQEQTSYRGTELPAPQRWGEPAPPKATLLQKAVILAAACVGFVLMLASVLERLF